MNFRFYLFLIISYNKLESIKGVKFSAESFFDISFLAKEGKFHLESLKEKANVPQYGLCWKNAISDLPTKCKFLSETVQSDLALKFTDCFLQMSGHEPISCDFPKGVCLQKLSDRAFNTYTEFYTHTQSICYFLQSQLWHEEAEKTIEKLSQTSRHVSVTLEHAEKVQEKLLNQQKESLFLQQDLIDTSKNVASRLKISQDKINDIMSDFQNSATEQKQLLLELIGSLLSLKSWAINEVTWLSSTVFFIAAIVIGFLFTSVSRTRGARLTIFIIFSLNYLFERLITSKSLTDIATSSVLTTEALNLWLWACRKLCVFLSGMIILYTALNYCDYNVLNYQLLLEIKNQNLKILNYFASEKNHSSYKLGSNETFKSSSYNHIKNCESKWNGVGTPLHSNLKDSHLKFYEALKSTHKNTPMANNSYVLFSPDVIDNVENESTENISISSETPKPTYNLRSSKMNKNQKLFEC